MESTDPLHTTARELDAYAETLDPESREYWFYHRKRFIGTLGKIEALKAECAYHQWPFRRLLDIGNSYQTLMVDKQYPEIQIDTLGFLAERYAPSGPFRHIEFDLNDSYFPDRWPVFKEAERYDLILFLEVIEHLYTSPRQVLRFLKTALNPGGFILIGTPNAAALYKRYSLLTGRNPYEPIREERRNPGHFREYTLDELCAFAVQAGFEVRWWEIANPFVPGSSTERRLNTLSQYLPQRFREAITVLIRAV